MFILINAHVCNVIKNSDSIFCLEPELIEFMWFAAIFKLSRIKGDIRDSQSLDTMLWMFQKIFERYAFSRPLRLLFSWNSS